MRIAVTKNSFRNITFGISNKILTLVLQFILRTMIIKQLGEVYIGLNSLFESIFQFLSLAELGLGTAVVQTMYRAIAHDDKNTISILLNTYRIFLRYVGIFIIGVGLCLLPLVSNFVKDGNYPPDINPVIIYIIFLINTGVSFIVLAYRGLLFNAFQRNDVVSKISTFIEIIKVISQICVLILWKNYYILILVYPIMTILSNVCQTLVSLKIYPEYTCKIEKISKKEIKVIYRKCIALTAQKLYSIVLNSADTITISYFLGLTELAIYGNYYYIIRALFQMFDIILSSLSGGIGNNIELKNREHNHRDFLKITYVYNLIVSGCSICLLNMFQPFMEIWVGKQLMFEDSTILVFVIYFYLWKIKDSVALYKDAAGLWWQDRYRPLICAGIDIILNCVFIHIWGINGVIIATIVSDFIISFPWCIYILYKNLFRDGLNQYIITLVSNIFFTISIWMISSYICKSVLFTGYVKVIICLVISVSIYLLGILAVFGRNNENKWVLNNLFDFLNIKCK